MERDADTLDFDPMAAPDDPWPALAEIRARGPVRRYPDRAIALVASYEEACAALIDTDTYASRARIKEDPAEYTIQSTDPPEHTRLRKLINRAFTAERVKVLEPRIAEICGTLIDALPERGPVDFMKAFALLLPTTVVAELLGVPEEDRARFKRWSDEHIRESVGGGRQPSTGEFRAWAHEQIIARRAATDAPDDLLTGIATSEVDGQRLTESEAASLVVILVIAGHETTTNAFGTAMHHLLGEPGLLERVRGDRALVPALAEETVRFDPPVTALPRRARCAAELGGTAIDGQDTVLVHLGAANHDPAVFADADRFDIDRGDIKQHVGFGFGRHLCVGAPLARAELRIGIDALLDRLDDLRLVPGREVPQAGLFPVRGPAQLWIDYTKR